MKTPLTRLEDLNISIRPFKQEDIIAIYKFLPAASIYGEVPFTPSAELLHFTNWLAEKNPWQHRFVAQSSQGIHGLVILSQNLRPRLQHSGSIILLVDSHHQPETTTKPLITVAIEMADRWLNLSRLQIIMPEAGHPALNFMQSFGFKVEGKRRMARMVEGEWVDNLLLARIRPDFQPQVSLHKPAILNSSVDEIPLKTAFKDLEIRPVSVNDAAAFHQMLKDPAIDRMTLQLPSIELLETEERVKKSSPWLHRYAAIADTEVVGSISLVQRNVPGYTHIGDIGMKVRRDYWGMGIGTALLEKITEMADKWLNILRLELDVNTDNPAGISLYKKCGFIIEGTKKYHSYGDGRWADSFFMARFKQY